MGNPGEITPAFAAAQAQKFPMALPLGSVLNGRYVIRRILGQGGFGITYAAWDHKYQALVAVKEYMPETYAMRQAGNPFITAYSADMQEQFDYGKKSFLEEARVLAKFLGHPHIVGARSYFEENGTAYLVMEYVEGVSFKAYIKNRGGQTNWQEALWVLRPIMEALTAVHQEGILHRDVTPDNIYLTSDGGVKLLDFGAARYSLGDKSRSLDVILKAGYAPKEQYMRRGRQGPWTDVYSVAACFYAAITGYLPPEALERLEEDNLIPICNRGIRIPEQLENAIMKGLAVDREDRFQTMGEFLQAMEGIYRDESLNSVIRNRVLQMHSGDEKPEPPQNPLPPRTDWRPPTGPVQSVRPPVQAVVQERVSPQAAGRPQKKKIGWIVGLSVGAVLCISLVLVLAMTGRKKPPVPVADPPILEQPFHKPEPQLETEPVRPEVTPERPVSDETETELIQEIRRARWSTDTEETAPIGEMYDAVFMDGRWTEEYIEEIGGSIVRFCGQGFDETTRGPAEFEMIFVIGEDNLVYLDYMTIDGRSVDIDSNWGAAIFGAYHCWQALSEGTDGVLEMCLSRLDDGNLYSSIGLSEVLFFLDLTDAVYEAQDNISLERTDVKVGTTMLTFVQNRFCQEAPQEQLLMMYVDWETEILDTSSLLRFYFGIEAPNPQQSPLQLLWNDDLSWDDMLLMEQTELNLLGWELAARNGMSFDNMDVFLRLYVTWFSWYDPIYSDEELEALFGGFNEVELTTFQNYVDAYEHLGYEDWENEWWNWFYT